MIIKLEDDYGDDRVSIDTDTASREELAKACIELKKAYDEIDESWNKRAAEMMDRCGLEFRGSKIEHIDIVKLMPAGRMVREGARRARRGGGRTARLRGGRQAGRQRRRINPSSTITAHGRVRRLSSASPAQDRCFSRGTEARRRLTAS